MSLSSSLHLDTLTYNDLVEEARKAIPTLDPAWTNHNPTDPGMVLIELFAWLTEMLSYRVDQVTDESLVAFLRLLNGPGWQVPKEVERLEQAKTETILTLRQCDRAITAADWERLLLEEWHKTPLDEMLALVFEERKEQINTILKPIIDNAEISIGEFTLGTDQSEKLKSLASAFRVRGNLGRDFNILSLAALRQMQQAWPQEILNQETLKLEALKPEALILSLTKESNGISRSWSIAQRNLALLGSEVEMPGHVSLVVMADSIMKRVKFPSEKQIPCVFPVAPGWLRVRAKWLETGIPLKLELGSRVSEQVSEQTSAQCVGLSPLELLCAPQDWADAKWYLNLSSLDDGSGKPKPEINGDIEIEYLPLQPSDALRALLWVYLDKRRLLTTHHHVVGPSVVPIRITADLFLPRDAPPKNVEYAACQAVQRYFHPLLGGPDQKGWPLGRAVYLSEIYQLLDKVAGVDYVENVAAERVKPGTGPNEKAELIGIVLTPYELVQVEFVPTLAVSKP